MKSPFFIARDADLSFLQQAWDDAKSGNPRFVVLVGDRGIGKTRIVHEFYARLSANQPLVNGQGYWPAELSSANTLGVNPPEASFTASPDVRLPWLWWGMRFQELRNPLPARELGDMLGGLAVHLAPMRRELGRRGLSQEAALQAVVAITEISLFAWTPPSLAANLLTRTFTKRFVFRDLREMIAANQKLKRPIEPVRERFDHDRSTLIDELLKLFRETYRADDKLPVLLFLDDAHGIDPDTLRFIDTLYREAVTEGWPLLVLCTHWEEEWEQAQRVAVDRPSDAIPRSLVELCRHLPEQLGRRHSVHCDERRIGPLEPVNTLKLLRSALPGLTDRQAKDIAARVMGHPRFLIELSAVALKNRVWFVDDDPANPLSEDAPLPGAVSGHEAILNIAAADYAALRRKQFQDLSEPIKHALGLASHQGTTFIGAFVSTTAARLATPCPMTEFENAGRVNSAFDIGPGPAYVSQFRDPAFYEAAREHLRMRFGDDGTAGSLVARTLLQGLIEWWNTDGYHDWSSREQIRALELFNHVLEEAIAGGGSQSDLGALREAALNRLEAVRRASRENRQVDEIVRRRAQAMTGHQGGVTCIAWDPKECWFATGDGYGEIIIWAVETGRALLRLGGNRGTITALKVSPDGGWLFSSGDREKDIQVWSTADGSRQASLAHDFVPGDIAVDPEGRWLATSCGKRALIWGLAPLAHNRPPEKIKEIWCRGPFSGVSLAVIPHKGWLACSRVTRVSLWTLDRRRPRRKKHYRSLDLDDHVNWNTLKASPDGRWLAWVVNMQVTLWDLNARWGGRRVIAGPKGEPRGSGEPHIYGLEFSADSRSLVVTGDHVIRIYDLPSGEQTKDEIRGAWRHKPFFGPAFAVGANGKWVAAGGFSGVAELIWLDDDKERASLNGNTDTVLVLSGSPTGRFVVSGGLDSSVRVWDTATGKPRHVMPGHHQVIRALAISPDGRWLASAGLDNLVRIWSPQNGSQIRALRGHKSGVTDRVVGLAVASDGRWLASTGYWGQVHRWELADQEAPDEPLPLHHMSALAILPGDRLLVAGSTDGDLEIWDREANETTKLQPIGKTGSSAAPAFESLASDPSSRWLAAGGGGSAGILRDYGGLWLWNPATKKTRELLGCRVSIFPSPNSDVGRVLTVAFSPDGRWLAAAGRDGKVRLWNPNGHIKMFRIFSTDPVRQRLFRLGVYNDFGIDDRAHDAAIDALVFAPDGTWLVTGDEAGKLRFWHIRSGALLHELQVNAYAIRALAVDPRGRRLYSTGDEGLIRRWILPKDLESEPYCRIALEPLPEEDWVVWKYPDDHGRRRWITHNAGARRWLGVTV